MLQETPLNHSPKLNVPQVPCCSIRARQTTTVAVSRACADDNCEARVFSRGVVFSTRAHWQVGCCAKIPREAFLVFSSSTIAHRATPFAVSRACADENREARVVSRGVVFSARAHWQVGCCAKNPQRGVFGVFR